MVSDYFSVQQVVDMCQDMLQDAGKSRTDEEDCLLKKRMYIKKKDFFNLNNGFANVEVNTVNTFVKKLSD